MKPDWLWFHRDIFPSRVCRLFARFWLFFLISVLSSPAVAALPGFEFMLEHIRHPVFTARSAEIKFTAFPSPALVVTLDDLVMGGHRWRNLRMECNQIHVSRDGADCDAGVLRLGKKSLSVNVQFSLQRKSLIIGIQPVPVTGVREKWRLEIGWQEDKWHGVLKIMNGDGTLLADLLPLEEQQIQIHQARLNGEIHLSGSGVAISALSAHLNVSQLSFGDASGLHAGEHISLQMDADARQTGKDWQWRGKIAWPEGGIFWQPFYFSGQGHEFAIAGTLHDRHINVTHGRVDLAGIGKAKFSAVADVAGRTLQQIRFSATDLELSPLFDSILRPLAVDTALAETSAGGRADFDWHYRDGEHQSLVIDLQDVSLIDAHDRFSIEELNAHIPWNHDEKRNGSIQFDNARVLGIPLGATRIPIETKGAQFNIPRAEVAVLDGKMQIENFLAIHETTGWQWQFNGALLPISMEKLTEALRIQPMYGTLSGTIPKMRYANSTITMEGELVSGIFDGVAVARNLVLENPLSLTPHLIMDMAMHHVDLDLLTRAYSFGSMQGRVDVEVNNLELVDWEPVRFDTKLVSSAGNYKRRISQAAIKNLIALGGGGAVTAIQRSFLGLFGQFSYAEIGWRCKLRGHICQMGGIEPATSDGKSYVLVKGSGIPAITITGYNQEVDWPELLKRLERAVESSNPIIH